MIHEILESDVAVARELINSNHPDTEIVAVLASRGIEPAKTTRLLDNLHHGRKPTIADVPGLIEGASTGAGLGHAFLRHVERTRVLLHIVDGASRDPVWDHNVIRDELEAHDPALLAKPQLVVFNKLDLAEARESWPEFAAAMRTAGRNVVAISADTGEGLDELRAAMGSLLPDAATLASPPDPAGVVVHKLEAAGDGFTLEHLDGMHVIHGKRIERLVSQTNFDNEESGERFQRELLRMGIDSALRRAGVRPGDDVRIGTTVLAWEPAEAGE